MTTQKIRATKPNFLRVEIMEYRNRGITESEEVCWKLHHISASEVEVKRMLQTSDYFLRVVECTKNGRIVVDSNNPLDWN